MNDDDIPDDDGPDQVDDPAAGDDAETVGANAVRAALGGAQVFRLGDHRRPRRRGDGYVENTDVLVLNERYGVVKMGGTVLVLEENMDAVDRRDGKAAPVEDAVRFLSPAALHAWFANDTVMFNGKPVAISRLWMTDPGRRQFEGVGFWPSPDDPRDIESGDADDPAPAGYYNLWSGFAVAPDPAGDCGKFLDHVRVNIAGENDDHYRWIIGWLADIFQHPAAKKGTALVLRSGQGTGKTFFGKVVGHLLGRHYALVDDPRYLTGQFNAHMAVVLLLQADEGFWAGDKQAEGRLKGLVTADKQFIERKGIDPVPFANHVRLLVTSNHDWVVPAGKDERRFAVFDVGDHAKQNHAYFAEIADQMENHGGYGRLLHELLTFDLDQVNVRAIPRTAALADQKMASLSPEESWWLTCLRRGWVFGGDVGEWRVRHECIEVYRNYRGFCEDVGQSRRLTPEQLGMALRRLAPDGFKRARGRRRDGDDHGPSRPWLYHFPPLDACRARFEELTSVEIDWEDNP